MGSCSRKNDINRRLILEEVGVQRILKEYFEDLYNIGNQEHVPVHMMKFGEAAILEKNKLRELSAR